MDQSTVSVGQGPKFVGEASPRDTECPLLTLNSQRSEPLTHTHLLKMPGRGRPETGKKGTGEGEEDKEGGV